MRGRGCRGPGPARAPSQVSTVAVSASSADVRPRVRPSAGCRKSMPARRARGRVRPGQRRQPLPAQALADRADATRAGGGSASGTEDSSMAPRRVTRRASTRPSDQRDLVGLVPQRRGRLEGEVLGQRRGADADGGVALARAAVGVARRRARRARSARTRRGAGRRRCPRPSGRPSPRAVGRATRSGWARATTSADGDVVGEPRLARRVPRSLGQRAAQAVARRPARRTSCRPAAAQRAQRGDQVAPGGADVLGEQRDDLRRAPWPRPAPAPSSRARASRGSVPAPRRSRARAR